MANVTLIDFSATWCGPCKRLAPIIDQLKAEYEGRAEVRKADVEEDEELAQQYGITAVPTLVFVVDGQEAARLMGAQSKAKIEETLNSLL